MVQSWVVTLPLMVWMFLEMVLGIHITSHLVMEIAMVAGAGFVLFAPGLQTLSSALKSSRNLTPNMDVLIALGTLASLLTGLMALGYHLGFYSAQFYSFAGIAAMIMAFHLTGRYIETKARGRASDAITKLLTLEAKNARIIRNGQEKEISVRELMTGDVMVVRPGEKIPTDGEIIHGKGTVDESMVTGESMPVLRQKGDEVIGGTINTEGSIRVKVSEVGEDTFLNRVIRMVEEAQGSKIPIQEFADRITAIFVPVILVLALFTFVAWFLFAEQLSPVLEWADAFIPWIVTGLEPLSQAFYASLAVLVIACPCALGLATPTALMVGTGMGAERGILIRKGEAIQRLQDVTTFVFDKTGTLTKGKPEVAEWITFEGSEEKLKQKIAAVEHLSEHPLSHAVLDFAGTENIPEVNNFQSITGMGVKGEVGGDFVMAGNADLLRQEQIGMNEEVTRHADALMEKGYTTIFLVLNKQVKAVCGITDAIKEGAVSTIQQLHDMNFKTVMLTGDQQKAADAIAAELGIDSVVAQVKPDEKSEAIRKLQQQGEVVAMVGDGVNDAPALSQADVGIALGTGTDIAIESGSIILIDGNPSALLKAITLSRHTFQKIRENLFWAFFYNVVMIPVAMVGWMHPVLAEVAMALSSINVVANSKRLEKKSLS
jgi:P-type Cu+ transporter